MQPFSRKPPLIQWRLAARILRPHFARVPHRFLTLKSFTLVAIGVDDRTAELCDLPLTGHTQNRLLRVVEQTIATIDCALRESGLRQFVYGC